MPIKESDGGVDSGSAGLRLKATVKVNCFRGHVCEDVAAWNV